MYHAHFGLEKGLFDDGIATDVAVFRSPKHDAVAANFKLALGSQSSGVVLRGPAGVGKSTLTSAVLRANSTRLALAWINATPVNAAELLELVLVEFGVNTVGTTRIERLQLWRQFQAETRATESRLFVVVERTEDLPTEVLHALDSLTAADAVGNLGANFVLLGHSAIEQHLAAPVLESLRQRIRLRAELVPFTEAELQDYLRHQVACAGGHFDHVFAPGTVAALQRLSGGVARLANSLCETALDVAASQQQKLLTPELVTTTAQSVLGLAEAVQATRTVEPTVVREPVVVRAPTLAVATPVATFVTLPPPAVEPPVLKVLLTTAPVTTPALAPVAAPALAPPAPLAPRILLAATAPLAPVPPAPAPAPVVVAAAPQARATSAAPAAPAAPVVATPPKREPQFEFDGGATDISDVASADFPVLTDAVDEPIVAPPKRAAAPTPIAPVAPVPRAPAPQPAVVARAPAAPPAAKPAAPPASRVETAYAAPKAAAKPAPAATPPPAPAAPATKATAPPAPPRMPAVDSDDDDLLRQTQTMRAISAAKSIDDISSSMAETLFGNADLDLVTAALAAAAAAWPDDQEEPPQVSAQQAPSKTEAQKAAASAEDPFDFLGLGDDAPLELMDDSTLPPINPTARSAAR